ncbi:hypothetical protein FOL47_004089 [Perkinsus chesapeaki]|uniref:Reelin domain-containing protein n=1 Tax=Perkinsus chesapeaki TaxID=330153 RepID=A0A7J6M5T5_PERCH|nr:hypothetical protein FOL47_004089 [Perkinsus chesapeaki]
MQALLCVALATVSMVNAAPPPLRPGNYLFTENDGAHGMVTYAIVKLDDSSETGTLRLVVSSPRGIAQGIANYRTEAPVEAGTLSRVNLIWSDDEHRRAVVDSITQIHTGFDLDPNDALMYTNLTIVWISPRPLKGRICTSVTILLYH